MSGPNYEPLWTWVREREATRIRKDSKAPMPWSKDPVIATYRFCNVRREDDRVTIWIRKHVRDPFRHHHLLWFMLCAARQINWPETLNMLIGDLTKPSDLRLYPGAWPDQIAFTPALMADALDDLASTGRKVFTGAYIINAPSVKGVKKTRYVAESVLGQLLPQRDVFKRLFNSKPTMREVHQRLTQYKGWGNFMAYQAVVDMRFTRLLQDASDRDEWAAAGPGTLRGLNRLHGRRLDYQLPQDLARREMREIYARFTSETGVTCDFSDIPNCLCETDKYLRALNGEGKPRALYVPGRGS